MNYLKILQKGIFFSICICRVFCIFGQNNGLQDLMNKINVLSFSKDLSFTYLLQGKYNLEEHVNTLQKTYTLPTCCGCCSEEFYIIDDKNINNIINYGNNIEENKIETIVRNVNTENIINKINELKNAETTQIKNFKRSLVDKIIELINNIRNHIKDKNSNISKEDFEKIEEKEKEIMKEEAIREKDWKNLYVWLSHIHRVFDLSAFIKDIAHLASFKFDFLRDDEEGDENYFVEIEEVGRIPDLKKAKRSLFSEIKSLFVKSALERLKSKIIRLWNSPDVKKNFKPKILEILFNLNEKIKNNALDENNEENLSEINTGHMINPGPKEYQGRDEWKSFLDKLGNFLYGYKNPKGGRNENPEMKEKKKIIFLKNKILEDFGENEEEIIGENEKENIKKISQKVKETIKWYYKTFTLIFYYYKIEKYVNYLNSELSKFDKLVKNEYVGEIKGNAQKVNAEFIGKIEDFYEELEKNNLFKNINPLFNFLENIQFFPKLNRALLKNIFNNEFYICEDELHGSYIDFGFVLSELDIKKNLLLELGKKIIENEELKNNIMSTNTKIQLEKKEEEKKNEERYIQKEKEKGKLCSLISSINVYLVQSISSFLGKNDFTKCYEETKLMTLLTDAKYLSSYASKGFFLEKKGFLNTVISSLPENVSPESFNQIMENYKKIDLNLSLEEMANCTQDVISTYNNIISEWGGLHFLYKFHEIFVKVKWEGKFGEKLEEQKIIIKIFSEILKNQKIVANDFEEFSKFSPLIKMQKEILENLSEENINLEKSIWIKYFSDKIKEICECSKIFICIDVIEELNKKIKAIAPENTKFNCNKNISGECQNLLDLVGGNVLKEGVEKNNIIEKNNRKEDKKNNFYKTFLSCIENSLDCFHLEKNFYEAIKNFEEIENIFLFIPDNIKKIVKEKISGFKSKFNTKRKKVELIKNDYIKKCLEEKVKELAEIFSQKAKNGEMGNVWSSIDSEFFQIFICYEGFKNGDTFNGEKFLNIVNLIETYKKKISPGREIENKQIDENEIMIFKEDMLLLKGNNANEIKIFKEDILLWNDNNALKKYFDDIWTKLSEFLESRFLNLEKFHDFFIKNYKDNFNKEILEKYLQGNFDEMFKQISFIEKKIKWAGNSDDLFCYENKINIDLFVLFAELCLLCEREECILINNANSIFVPEKFLKKLNGYKKEYFTKDIFNVFIEIKNAYNEKLKKKVIQLVQNLQFIKKNNTYNKSLNKFFEKLKEKKLPSKILNYLEEQKGYEETFKQILKNIGEMENIEWENVEKLGVVNNFGMLNNPLLSYFCAFCLNEGMELIDNPSCKNEGEAPKIDLYSFLTRDYSQNTEKQVDTSLKNTEPENFENLEKKLFEENKNDKFLKEYLDESTNLEENKKKEIKGIFKKCLVPFIPEVQEVFNAKLLKKVSGEINEGDEMVENLGTKGTSAEAFLYNDQKENHKKLLVKIIRPVMQCKAEIKMLYETFINLKIKTALNGKHKDCHVKNCGCKNIIKIYNVFYCKKYISEYFDGALVVVMEYADKGDLKNKIKYECKDLSLKTIASYFKQLVDGLIFLHSLNILHMDVKLANIVFGNDELLKLIDFGYSIFYNDEKNLVNNIKYVPSNSFWVMSLEQFKIFFRQFEIEIKEKYNKRIGRDIQEKITQYFFGKDGEKNSKFSHLYDKNDNFNIFDYIDRSFIEDIKSHKDNMVYVENYLGNKNIKFTQESQKNAGNILEIKREEFGNFMKIYDVLDSFLLIDKKKELQKDLNVKSDKISFLEAHKNTIKFKKDLEFFKNFFDKNCKGLAEKVCELIYDEWKINELKEKFQRDKSEEGIFKNGYNVFQSDWCALLSYVLALSYRPFFNQVFIEDLEQDAKNKIEQIDRQKLDSLLEKYCYLLFNSIFEVERNKEWNEENIEDKYIFNSKEVFLSKDIESCLPYEIKEVLEYIMNTCFIFDAAFKEEKDKKVENFLINCDLYKYTEKNDRIVDEMQNIIIEQEEEDNKKEYSELEKVDKSRDEYLEKFLTFFVDKKGGKRRNSLDKKNIDAIKNTSFEKKNVVLKRRNSVKNFSLLEDEINKMYVFKRKIENTWKQPDENNKNVEKIRMLVDLLPFLKFYCKNIYKRFHEMNYLLFLAELYEEFFREEMLLDYFISRTRDLWENSSPPKNISSFFYNLDKVRDFLFEEIEEFYQKKFKEEKKENIKILKEREEKKEKKIKEKEEILEEVKKIEYWMDSKKKAKKNKEPIENVWREKKEKKIYPVNCEWKRKSNVIIHNDIDINDKKYNQYIKIAFWDRNGSRNWFFVSDISSCEGSGMFENVEDLTGINIYLSSSIIEKKFNFKKMFYGCKNLKKISFSKYGEEIVELKVEDMSYMCSGCSSLEKIDFDKDLEITSIKNMSHMFYNCTSLTEFMYKYLDTSNVEDMSYMFYNCNSMRNTVASDFETYKQQVERVVYNFFRSWSGVDHNTDSWLTDDLKKNSRVPIICVRQGDFFHKTKSFVINLKSVIERDKKTIEGILSYSKKLDLSEDQIEKYRKKLKDATAALGKEKLPDVTLWDLLADEMFGLENEDPLYKDIFNFHYRNGVNVKNEKLRELLEAKKISNPYNDSIYKMDIEGETIDILKSRVYKDIYKRYNLNANDYVNFFDFINISPSDTSLNKINFENFNTGNVKNMSYMFCKCTGLFSTNLSKWDFSNVTNMEGLFAECKCLKYVNFGKNEEKNEPIIPEKNVNKDIVRKYMFYNCINLIMVDINDKIANVQNLPESRNMFWGTKSLLMLSCLEKYFNNIMKYKKILGFLKGYNINNEYFRDDYPVDFRKKFNLTNIPKIDNDVKNKKYKKSLNVYSYYSPGKINEFKKCVNVKTFIEKIQNDPFFYFDIIEVTDVNKNDLENVEKEFLGKNENNIVFDIILKDDDKKNKRYFIAINDFFRKMFAYNKKIMSVKCMNKVEFNENIPVGEYFDFFRGCENLMFVDWSLLNIVTINGTFRNCKSLRYVKLPNTLKKIKSFSFCGSNNLILIDGLNSVENVSINYTFSNTNKLFYCKCPNVYSHGIGQSYAKFIDIWDEKKQINDKEKENFDEKMKKKGESFLENFKTFFNTDRTGNYFITNDKVILECLTKNLKTQKWDKKCLYLNFPLTDIDDQNLDKNKFKTLANFKFNESYFDVIKSEKKSIENFEEFNDCNFNIVCDHICERLNKLNRNMLRWNFLETKHKTIENFRKVFADEDLDPQLIDIPAAFYQKKWDLEQQGVCHPFNDLNEHETYKKFCRNLNSLFYNSKCENY